MNKLCYILPEYNENVAGHFYHQYELLDELSKKLDIFLIIEKSRDKSIKFGNFKKIYIQKFKFTTLRFLESFLVILWARILGYNKFYTHYCYIGGINAAIISRLFGGKSYYWNCAMNWLFRRKMLQGIGYKLSLKFSHFLVTGSEEMKKGYAEHHNLSLNKIKVMPNWINLDRFKIDNSNILNKRSDQTPNKTILFVHWLSKRKGADMIVPIIRHLLSDYKLLAPNLKLLVVGNGPYKEKLIEEIKENKLEKFIDVLGGVPNQKIINYYNKADIFIMPSMEEGFPHVLLESMASGVPYVASDVGAVREISPEIAQRFLTKPGEVEKFVQKIEVLMTDSKTYKKFQEEGLEKVKEFSLDKVIDKFIKIIL